METDAFAEGLQALLGLIHGLRTAVMCAEALWWRCSAASVFLGREHPRWTPYLRRSVADIPDSD
jgi:hypothetical protein